MFNLINTSCPYSNWVSAARRLCVDPDRYHCLTDEFSRPGWICADPIWVEANRCPEFNIAANKMDSVPCLGNNCPYTNYKSFQNHLYEGCRTAVNVVHVEMSTDSKLPNSTLTSNEMKNHDFPMLTVTLGVIFGILALSIFVSILLVIQFRRRKNHRDSAKDPEEEKQMLDPEDKKVLTRVKRALQTERFVVLKGIQGAGKTFLAERLQDEWQKQNIDVQWISDEKCVFQTSNRSGNFILDDLFHELQTEKEVEDVRTKVDAMYEEVVVSGHGKILLTVTSIILNRFSSLFQKRNYENVIDLDKICEEDRKDILEFHMKRNDIVRVGKDEANHTSGRTISEADYQRILKSYTATDNIINDKGIGMPAAIATACIAKRNDNSKDIDIGRFIKSPMSWLHLDITRFMQNKSSKESIIALALVSLETTGLTIDSVNSDCLNKLKELENVNPDEESLATTLQNLTETYIENNNGIYTFKIPLVRKVVLKVLFSKHPELVEYCDDMSRHRRVCNSIPTDMEGEYKKSFYVQEAK